MNGINQQPISKFSLSLLIFIVLTAFAANSILCRLALKPSNHLEDSLIDPMLFTIIRLLSGSTIFILWFILFKHPLFKPLLLHFKGAVYLFVYALTFSFAYISMDAASGALILFGTVQLCIITIHLLKKNRLKHSEWLGSLIAIIGLMILTLPKWLGSSVENNYLAIILMFISGIAWGLFTVNGANSKRPISDMAYCFILGFPLCLVTLVGFILWQSDLNNPIGHILNNFFSQNISGLGFTLAILSGTVTSAIGYVLWYKLLPLLNPSHAGTSQLLVPILTAIGGYLLLNETLELNFFLASAFTLGGILLVLKEKNN